MVDDTSHIFEISDTLILAHMSTTYLQPQILWRLYPPAATTAFMRDIHAVQEAVRVGTNQDAQHQSLYR